MCGIAGFVGRPIVSFNLVDALASQLYLGQEGFGFAALLANGGMVVNHALALADLPCDIVAPAFVGHNRLPTHGGPMVRNCHPFVGNCKGVPVAVVHNGVVRNFRRLREQLREDGHVFSSEVDSEVLAHIAENYAGDPRALVNEVNRQCQGSITAAFLLPVLLAVVLFRNHLGAAVYVNQEAQGWSFASDWFALTKLMIDSSDYRQMTVLPPFSAKLVEINGMNLEEEPELRRL